MYFVSSKLSRLLIATPIVLHHAFADAHETNRAEFVADNHRQVISPTVEAFVPPGLPDFLRHTDGVFRKSDAVSLREGAYEMLESHSMPLTVVNGLLKIANTIDQGPQASASAIYGENGRVAACIVVAPEPEYNQEIWGIWDGTLPGLESDWYAFSLMHEDAHCDDAKDGQYDRSLLKNEVIADFGAGHLYYKAYRAGVVTDAEVPYTARFRRAEQIMTDQLDSRYTVNSIIPLPEEQSVLARYPSNDAAKADIIRAREEIFRSVGGALAMIDREEMLRILAENPQALYAIAELKLSRGDFDGNPAGKAFVKNFVDGAQRYKVIKYGVPEWQRPEGRPAIVDYLAKKFAPPSPSINPTATNTIIPQP